MKPTTTRSSSKPLLAKQRERLMLLTLTLVQFTHIVDYMIIMPLGAQLMGIFHITPGQFSLLVSAYATAAFVASFIAALFVDRFDRKHVLSVAYLGCTLGTIACALAPSFPLLLIARAMAGAFGGLIGAVVLAIIGDAIPFERRARATGMVMMAFSGASVIGVPLGLYLAAQFSWRMPFFAVSIIAILLQIAIWQWVPNMRRHISAQITRPSPAATLHRLFSDRNQVRALLFTIILMLGHFTIIPFIAPYMQLNVGFSNFDLTYIYLIGGSLTVICLPLFGYLADRYGNVPIFTTASLLAVISIWTITHLPPVPMWLALIATSSYFVVGSGRNVPATTLVTAVVRSEHRGSFMSMRTSFNQLGLALASLTAGALVSEAPNGMLAHYEYAGFVAIAMSIMAIFVARRLKVVD